MANVISMKQHREIITRAKVRAMAPAKVVLRGGALTLTGALIGYLESKGTLPAGILKNAAGRPMIPTKVAIAVAAHAVAAFSKGSVSQAASIVGDTAAANYGYAAGLRHAVIAGE